MFAIIGFGNPGAKYALTRHNVGFRVAEAFAAGVLGSAAAIHWETKHSCKFLRLTFEDRAGLIVLPQKFMNLSGEAAGPLLQFFKISPEEVVVVHDDLDLDLGMVRIKHGGGCGGHHGLEDLLRVLGDDRFYRVRVGIGHPHRGVTTEGNRTFQGDISDWVLQKPRPDEEKVFAEAEKKACHAISLFLSHGLAMAQREIHRKD